MSVNTVTGGSIALQTLKTSLQDQKNQLNQAQQSLQQSLSVGNLDGAQKAYDTLSKLIQNGPGGKDHAFGGNKTLQNDFKALGDALKSGDANSAQKAYAQFTQDLQSAQQARQQSSGQVDSDGDHDNSGVSGPGLYA